MDLNNQREMMKEFERAHAIVQLLQHPGYQYLLDIMEAEVVRDEKRLLEVNASVPDHVLRNIQIAAQLSRSKFERLQLQLNAAVETVAQQLEPAPIEY